MKEIKLTQGKVTLVDDEDYEYLNQWKWHTVRKRNIFYAERRLSKVHKQKIIIMHRVIMKTPSNLTVDHINHNGLDNRKINLRNCTNQQNLMNRLSRDNSNYLGVSYNNKGFIRARIGFNRYQFHLGYFKNEIEAALAYDKKAKILFGEFANLNFK